MEVHGVMLSFFFPQAKNSDVPSTQLLRSVLTGDEMDHVETLSPSFFASLLPVLDSCLPGSLSKIILLYKSPCHKLCFL